MTTKYKGYDIEVVGNTVLITNYNTKIKLPYLNGMSDEEQLSLAKSVIDDERSLYPV